MTTTITKPGLDSFHEYIADVLMEHLDVTTDQALNTTAKIMGFTVEKVSEVLRCIDHERHCEVAALFFGFQIQQLTSITMQALVHINGGGD